jgi:hypothetical protein
MPDVAPVMSTAVTSPSFGADAGYWSRDGVM